MIDQILSKFFITPGRRTKVAAVGGMLGGAAGILGGAACAIATLLSDAPGGKDYTLCLATISGGYLAFTNGLQAWGLRQKLETIAPTTTSSSAGTG